MIRLALIQHRAPLLSNPTTPSHCLTRLHSDKPSPIPTGPLETLNAPLKRFRPETFTFVSEFSRGEQEKKEEARMEGAAAGFQNSFSGTRQKRLLIKIVIL